MVSAHVRGVSYTAKAIGASDHTRSIWMSRTQNKRFLLFVICSFVYICTYVNNCSLKISKMSEALMKFNDLFMRDCTFMSDVDQPINIKQFINGLNFEWKLCLGSYKLHNQFHLEILDIPNNVLGLRLLNNWNVFSINIDPNGFLGGVKEIKKDLFSYISKFVDIEKVLNNRIIIFTIKYTY